MQGAAAKIGALNTGTGGSAYFEFTLTPSSGFTVNLTGISFGTRSTSTGPQAYSLRSSLDGYAIDIATGTIANNSTWTLKSNTGLTTMSSSGTPITFRIYGYNGAGSASANTANWRIDDLTLNVTVASTSSTPSVNLSVSSNTGTEAGTTAITVTATASQPVTGDQTVSLGVSGTNITAGDYTLSSTTITIPNGATTGSVTFTVVDDAAVEGTETAVLTISNPSAGITIGSPASQNITITDNDAPPTVSVTAGSNAAEPTTNGSFTINFSTPTTTSTDINFEFTGMATFTSDYTITYSAGTTGSTASTGTLTVPAGTSSVTVTATPVDDAAAEATETITLTLSTPTQGYVLGTATATINLADNDSNVSVAAGNNAAEPATNGSFTITLSSPAPAGGVTVNYTLSGTATANTDYSDPQSGSVTIAQGNTTGTITLNTIDDAVFEGTETITITLTSASNGYSITTATATIDLTDNETVPPVVINEVYGGGGNSGATWKNDFIELYNNSSTAVSLAGWSVQYAGSSGTTWQVTNLSGSIPANGYYLIQQAAGTATGTFSNLPAPDATGTIPMSATAGKIALVINTTPLSGSCPAGPIADLVGYGSANCFEGTAPTPAPSATHSVQRVTTGADNNQNNTDFGLLSPPTPTNSQVDVIAPTITSLSPADGTTGMNTSFIATITFSENIQKGTGTITIKRVADGSTEQTIDVTNSSVSTSGTSASFGVHSLQFGTDYYIEVSNGAFKDAANNNFAGITGATAWNFSTAATPPAGVVGTTYNFNNCPAPNLPDGFTQYSVTGSIIWSCTKFGRTYTVDPSSDYAVQINGFSGGTNVPNVDWLISPSFDLTATTYPLLSFWSRTAFNGDVLQLKVSTNYPGTGDPNAPGIIWTDLNGKFPLPTSDVWTESSNINLSAYKGSNVYIAFVYESTDEEGARWTIDDFRINNSATPPPASITTGATDIQFNYTAAGATSDKTFTFTGNDITTDVTLTATGDFLLSKDGTTFTPSITYTQAEANNITKTVTVRFAPTQSNQNQTGSITITTSGLTATINLKGTSIDPATTLEVVNWNIEWFSSPTLGPANDAQQEQNVTTILQRVGADIYGLLEVVDEAALAAVVAQMPGYTYVISNYGSHTNTCVNPPSALADAQKLAFVYKSSVFTNVSTTALLSAGINTCADASSTSYNNWASGRYPFQMSADVTLNGITKPVKFVLVHAKANTSPTDVSYDRRKRGADELHTLLETPAYATENIIIFGDYNDDLDQSITANKTTTSWDAFTTDNADFPALTLPLSLAGKKSTVSYNDVIDHVVVSNEMNQYYMSSTASILTDVENMVSNYANTTSDHYPVFTRFAFAAAALPLNLLSFTGAKENNAVKLEWQTSDEVGTKEFIIERSANGRNFEAIGSKPAAGNSSSVRNYSFTDLQPLSGNNIYRLKMVDLDGRFELSKLVKINFGNTYSVTVAPNPVASSFYVTTTFNGPAYLQIMDMSGRVVKKQVLVNQKEKVLVGNLQKGLYVVKIINVNETFTQKITVQ